MGVIIASKNTQKIIIYSPIQQTILSDTLQCKNMGCIFESLNA